MKSREQSIESILRAMREADEARAPLRDPAPTTAGDLTMAQWRVIQMLRAQGPARTGVIAETIGATTTSITGILDRVEERGLIERSPDPSDRRAVLIRLTPEGRSYVRGVYAAGGERLAATLQRMSDEGLAALDAGMGEFAALVAARGS